MAKLIKVFSLITTMLIIVTISFCFAQEEITLTTIMPSQEVVRGRSGVIGDDPGGAWYHGTIPEQDPDPEAPQIGRNNLIVGGQVGIGTLILDPNRRLHVLIPGGDTSANIALFQNTSTTNIVEYAKGLDIDYTGSKHSGDDGSLAGLYVNMGTEQTVANLYSAIFLNGKVGIGTDNPDVPLHVYSDNDAANLIVEGVGQNANVQARRTSTDKWARLVVATTIETPPEGYSFGLDNDGTNKLCIGDINFDNKYLTIDGSNGNVGIGENNPDSPLHIYKAESGSNMITLETTDNTYDLRIGTGGRFIIRNGANDRLCILNTGEIGIGTRNPSYLLQMESSVGGYYSISDHTWHTGSSLRALKTDIRDWAINATELAKDIKLRRFRYKNADSYSVGFVAEELPKDMPEEVISETGNISSRGAFAFLLKAVQEQQVRIEELERRLQESL